MKKSRPRTITALNAKCAKAKRYPRKAPDALALYFRAVWDEQMRRNEQYKVILKELRHLT